MHDESDLFVAARNLAVDILRNESKRTSEQISEVGKRAAQAVAVMQPGTEINLDKLLAELRHLFSVGVETATILDDDDPTGHKPWLPDRRADIKWKFWKRYSLYLERDFGMAPAAVDSLNGLTDMILERLEDPTRAGPWDRRGMVVGSVQSGKTANYTGLICKAVDAGYKLIIVLAGLHSNLRSQTQLRIDEGVLGFDTKKSRKLNKDNQWIGVGKLPGPKLHIHSLTSSADDGDFKKGIAETVGVMIGGTDPIVLVVKKNAQLLKNLRKWVLSVSGFDPDAIVPNAIVNVPLLLIDDEADNASINTKDKKSVVNGQKVEVSAINGRIREILSIFEKSAYVGYTATPFANIFVNPDAQSEHFGDDIFPRSFIVNVKAPSNYVGPAKVFGLAEDLDSDLPSYEGLPIVQPVDDYDSPSYFPPRHRRNHVPSALPPSLRKAIRCFLLTCAARCARNQERKHNSMLVHVSRFVDVQGHVVDLIRTELVGLQRRLEFGDGSRSDNIEAELATLWETEFVPVTESMSLDAGLLVTWDDVKSHLYTAASKIVVLAINAYAKEELDYKEHEKSGRSVIAVGGDKLSRGLTLEGLSVSYFLRTSRMYDTLLQMGRWFGYRDGYLDLCRLFTPPTLIQWYRHIALAEAELRREFDYMVAQGLDPKEYGLRVRTHPDGMIVTALNKMCHSQSLELSWAGVLVQTTQLPKSPDVHRKNLNVLTETLSSIGPPTSEDGLRTRLWKNVAASQVAQLLEALKYPPESARAGSRELSAFITQQAAKDTPELTDWTVALVSVHNADSMDRYHIAQYEVGMVERTPELIFDQSYSLRKANILSPGDEGLDFKGVRFGQDWLDAVSDKEELVDDLEWLEQQVGHDAYDVALDLTKRWQAWDPAKLASPGNRKTLRPNGHVLRVLRPKTKGLLLIYPLTPRKVLNPNEKGPPIVGVALSFPTSRTVQRVEYRVNRVWNAQIEEDALYED